MPLQSINASSTATHVILSVFDPAAGRVVQTNVNSATPTNLVVKDGIAAWWSDYSTYCMTYDPIRTNWFGTASFVLGGPPISPRIDSGIVAWIEQNRIHSVVYSQIYGQWLGAPATAYPVGNFYMADGVLVWTSSDRIGYRTFDPADGFWREEDRSFSASSSPFFNSNGVVAWSIPLTGQAYAAAYDSNRRLWRYTSAAAGPVTHLLSDGGVVAWFKSPMLSLQLYDPVRGRWNETNANTGGSSIFSISNSTVHWRHTSGSSHTFGYDPGSGRWESNAITRPLACFSTSVTNGNAPLPVYFADMSVGGSTWNWNFDDGGTSTARSPSHRFLGHARHNVSLSLVNSSGQSSSTNFVIQTDVAPPTGRLLINGGLAWTPDPLVSLHTLATDNSGVIASNRFSNDNTNWTAWESFITNRTWSLIPGFGPKSVRVQLSDALANVSTIGAPILLHTSPPPVVSYLSTNVSELTGTATIWVLLNQTSQWPVSVRCVSSNGTAAAADYLPFSRLLVFNPGAVELSFNAFIQQDLVAEPDETVILNFVNPTNVTAGSAGTLTILDDDAPPLLTSPRIDQASRFEMTVVTAPGRRVTIQYSTTLTNWTALVTLTNTTGSLEFSDINSPDASHRFYRAILNP